MSDPTCNLCGHPASSHGIAGDDIVCRDCPDQACPDGQGCGRESG